MYDIQESIFQITAKSIPIHLRISNRETLETTEWESENGNHPFTSIPYVTVDVLSESNGSDKGPNDWILDEELMKPMADLLASEGNSREKLLATR
jgi:hypothetical protein